MWFCEMRQMPRLRDCAYEVAIEALQRARDVVGSLERRFASIRPNRAERITSIAVRLQHSKLLRTRR